MPNSAFKSFAWRHNENKTKATWKMTCVCEKELPKWKKSMRHENVCMREIVCVQMNESGCQQHAMLGE